VTTVRYCDYLELDTLLSLQRPRVPASQGRVHAAEHLFIVVHQCCELWLAQILLDLDHATAALSAPRAAEELALEHLSRVAGAFGTLHEQVMVLDRLPYHCFARFRPYLGTASGSQSAQFQELDRKLGLGLGPGPGASPVATAFAAAADRAGLDIVDICRADLRSGALHRIVDVLLEIGQGYWRWKIAHLAVVSRLLGDIGGTAGTSGADYLARRVRMPFPEVRDAQQLAHFGDRGLEAVP
jgi:tryptophan 2,3-dioxygenase